MIRRVFNRMEFSTWTTKNNGQMRSFHFVFFFISILMLKIISLQEENHQNTRFTIFSVLLMSNFCLRNFLPFWINSLYFLFVCSSIWHFKSAHTNIKRMPDRTKYCFKPFHFITLNAKAILNGNAGRRKKTPRTNF